MDFQPGTLCAEDAETSLTAQDALLPFRPLLDMLPPLVTRLTCGRKPSSFIVKFLMLLPRQLPRAIRTRKPRLVFSFNKENVTKE